MIKWKLKKLFDFGKTEDFYFCYMDVVRMIKEIKLLKSLGHGSILIIEDSETEEKYIIESVKNYLKMLENGFE